MKNTKIRESHGAKAYDTLEIISKMIIFHPSSRSIHWITTPLLERLRHPTTSSNDTRTLRKTHESLKRVVIGLSRNRSVEVGDMMPFVYATIEPFVREAMEANGGKSNLLKKGLDSDSDSDDDHNI